MRGAAAWQRNAPKEDEAYRAWIRQQDCLLDFATWHEYQGEVEPHHVHARRRFGDWLECGAGNLVPLCHGCHRYVHDQGRDTAIEKLGVRIDLQAEAFRYGCRFLWTRVKSFQRALEELHDAPAEVQEFMREHGFTMERAPSGEDLEDMDDGERWEHYGFQVYTVLVQHAEDARRRLERAGVDVDKGSPGA